MLHTNEQGLDLAEILQDGVDHLECLVDLLSDLRTSKDNLATDEDEKHDLRLDHAVDKTGEQLGLVRTEVVMAGSQTLQANGELDITRADDVLDLEVRELGVEPKLLDDTSIFAACKLRVVFGLGTSDNHLARGKNKRSGLGITDTHNDGSETLKVWSEKSPVHLWNGMAYLGVVLCVASVQSNRLEIQAAIEVDRGDDVS